MGETESYGARTHFAPISALSIVHYSTRLSSVGTVTVNMRDLRRKMLLALLLDDFANSSHQQQHHNAMDKRTQQE
ncbi:hypothetical protein ABVT39_020540 [Epinephelus coioides]